jgi:hypothetical protein
MLRLLYSSIIKDFRKSISEKESYSFNIWYYFIYSMVSIINSKEAYLHTLNNIPQSYLLILLKSSHVNFIFSRFFIKLISETSSNRIN